MSEPILNLLLVDDEDSVREPLARHLRAEPYKYEVKDVSNFEEALQALEKTKGCFDVALIDEVLKEGLSGLDLLRQIKTQYPQIECILFTGWGMQSGLEALRAGAYRYFAKPFNPEELALTIRFAAEQRQNRREREYLSSLVQVSHDLTQTTDLENQLVLVWNFVQKRLATATFFIALYDSKTDTLRFPLSFDEGEPDPLPDRYLGDDPSGWGVAGHVVKNRREQVWFSRDQAEQGWQALGIMPQISGKGASETGICLPLQVGGKILGALSVQSYQPQAFDQAFSDAVRTLGSHVAPAIENTRLFSNLERTSNHLEGLIESSLDAIISIDKDKHITVFNKQAEKMLGYTADEMRGRTVARLHPDLNEASRIWDLVDQQSKIVSHEFTLKYKDGMEIPTLLSAVSIRDVEGNAIGQAGFLRDLRQIHLLEERLRALIRAGKAIGSLLDINQILQLIMDSSIAAFPTAEKGSIHLFDEKTEKLHIKACYGYSAKVANALTLRIGEGFAGWVYEHGEPIVSGNVWEDKRFKEFKYPETQKQKSTICTPLEIKGIVIGTISLDNLTAFDAFKPDDVELLSTFADQAAIAYDNARRMRELEHMRKAAEAMAGALEPAHVLQQIVESASEVLQADSSAIWSYDNTRNQFIPEELVAHSISADKLKRFQKKEPKKGGTADTVMDLGWVGVRDISDPQYNFMGTSTVELLNSIGAKSFQGIVLKIGEEKLGVLYVNYNHPKSFAEEDRRTLEIFAYHAALSLKKARLLEQVSKARDAAKVVSQVSILEELRPTLDSIVRGTQAALGCDAVTLYTYDQEVDEFSFPPAMVGIEKKTGVLKLRRVEDHSVVRNILALEKAHEAEVASSDSLMQGPFVFRENIKSSVGIPLRVGDRKVGVMFVNYRSHHRFTADESTNIELFANQAAVAIRNAQLHSETKKRAETLEGLYKAGKAVTDILTLNEILERIAEQAWRLVRRPASYTSIRLVENEVAKVVAAYPPEELAQSRATIPEIDLRTGVNGRFGVTGRAIKTGIPQLVDDVSSDNDYLPSHPQTRSELAVPIKLGERPLGVINVESLELRGFGKDDEQTLISLAGYAAIAINNAQLHKEQAETLEGLYEAGKAITSTLAVDEVLSRIAEQALHIVGANPQEGCFSHIALREGNKLKFIAASSTEMLNALNRVEIDLETSPKKGIAGRAVLTALSRNVPDVKSDPDYIPAKENINSQLSVPLKIGERIIGVLSIEHPKPAAFNDEDVKNVELLAAQAAVAIENAQRYEVLEKTKEVLAARTALAWTGMASSTWRHAIEKRAITIRDEIELLRRDLANISKSDMLGKRLDKIERLADKIREKPITPPLSAEEGVQSISINDLIRERTRQLWADEPYRYVSLKLELRTEDSETVRASPEWLRRALDILIDNAVDAMASSPERRLNISSKSKGNLVEISIADNGNGIPEDIRGILFRQPIKKLPGAKGLGMGLMFSQMIAQTYSGSIYCQETGSKGTTMVVSLPLEP